MRSNIDLLEAMLRISSSGGQETILGTAVDRRMASAFLAVYRRSNDHDRRVLMHLAELNIRSAIDICMSIFTRPEVD